MIIEFEIVGFRDDYLAINEKNHKVAMHFDDKTWADIGWQEQVVFLDEMKDVLRHTLTKFGQVEYRIINANKGLSSDDNNN